jgi:deoxyribodipyrimidine photo-lyase
VSTPRRALILFTRDLRVHDHPALAAAVGEADEVIPAFILDSELLRGSCGAANRVAFLLGCLADLDSSLKARGARLTVREGDFVEQAMRLAKRWRVEAIHMSADHSPYARRRHERLARACAAERIALRRHGGPSILAPGAVTPAGGDHYRIFTPYWRSWTEVPLELPAPTPRRIATPAGAGGGRIPPLRHITASTPSPEPIGAGESEGRLRLARWLRRGLGDYELRHDALALDGTSHLSAYLHFGCLSARSVRERAAERASSGDFLRQLCWRDFHQQVLAARPDLPHADYRPRGDNWRDDPHALEAWREGLTGYPIVDAGMRQLKHEGFMHNRARLVVASFLTKTLYIDWRAGAAHFARLLIDADVANNVGNWQWVAGTGNDTRPNRVLNPLMQARRFDPRGDYVRRYVPELSAIDGARIHEPWRLAAKERRALGYPAPLIDHRTAADVLHRRRRTVGLPA